MADPVGSVGVDPTDTAPHPMSAGIRGLQDSKAGNQHPLPPASSSKPPGLPGAAAGLVQRFLLRQESIAWEFIPRALQEKSTHSFQSSRSSPSR